MAICYDRLFHMMIDRKITNAQLKKYGRCKRKHNYSFEKE